MSIKIDKALILNSIKSHYGFKSNADFAGFLGIAPTTLSSWYTRNTFDYELLYAKCEDVDGNWLITGKGNMIKSLQQDDSKVLVREFKHKTDDMRRSDRVPLYNIDAVAGIVAIFDDLHKQKPTDYLSIPNLPKCDGAVHVTGDSMYPLLKSGDIIAYKVLKDKSNIFWGEMYLLSIDFDGDTYITVKYVQKSEKEGCVKLVSQNQYHQDKDVPFDSVKFAALVKASIRINSMG